MPHSNRWLAAGLVLACLPLSACGRATEFDNEAASDEGPAKVEPIKGRDVARVILTAQAARRIGIRTAPVREQSRHLVVPYAAIVYDARGRAYAFTSPRPRVFVRRRVSVEDIVRDRAILHSGPAVGTPVVTVGAAELLGTEYGVEEE